MLDDLRNSAMNSPQPEEEPPEELEVEERLTRRRRREPFLGMSAGQRFAIVLLLFMMTCVLGAFCLVVFNKVVLPF